MRDVGTLRWGLAQLRRGFLCGARGSWQQRGTWESRTGVKIHLRSKLVVCRRRLCGGREELEVGKTEGNIGERVYSSDICEIVLS